MAATATSKPNPISLLFPSESIRAYQRELAEPGLDGKNYIICAPTGSGKTLIAAMIISEHLKKGQEIGEKRKVLFMVKTKQLAHQQKEKLDSYIRGMRSAMFIGDGEYAQQLIAPILPKLDLIICTAGKIRNELQNKSVTIGQFSLIVVDECHHTVGSDQYSEVLEFYLMDKFEERTRLPQVIGLTASPGAGKGGSPTLLKAISHQFDLCAHLDAVCGIKMVTDNKDELSDHSNKPEHYRRVLECYSIDNPFIDLITKEMIKLETRIQLTPPFSRSTQNYRSWAEIEREAAHLRKSPEERDRITTLEYLIQYYLALITCEDFTYEDAIEILRELPQCSVTQATTAERHLQSNHYSLLSHLTQLVPRSNPLLKEVEGILFNQFTTNPASKAIFFVREIRHTRYVQRWVESCERLSQLVRVSPIVGSAKSAMSNEKQKKVIQDFKDDKFNLLASTTVLEEGIDVATCNLVIRFQMMSSEIGEVQAQGRARADNSKMYSIMSSQSCMKYQQLVNEEKKFLALKAPSFVTELCTTMAPKFEEMQKAILSEREARESAKELRHTFLESQEVDVVCKKCKIVFCKGCDIFKFERHYVVPHPSFQEKLVRRVHHKPWVLDNVHTTFKIYCKNCDQDWGVWSWWPNYHVQYPVLKCASFTFFCNRLPSRSKQWSKVSFEILPLPSDLL